MLSIFKPVHVTVTKAYAAPAVKPFLTHTGVAGFTAEFLNALIHTVAHVAPIAVPAYLMGLAEAYMPWRDLTIGWAALALGLVIYCDNAHHVLSSMERHFGDKEKETQ